MEGKRHEQSQNDFPIYFLEMVISAESTLVGAGCGYETEPTHL